MINEHVTIHAAIEPEEATSISNDCYIMTKSHIGHDAIIESEVTLACLAIIGGHSIVMRGANIGLAAVLHQKRAIGNFAMVGMNATVSRSIPPFMIAMGSPARVTRVNKIGMERRNFNAEFIAAANSWMHHLMGAPLQNVPGINDVEEYIQRWSDRVVVLDGK